MTGSSSNPIILTAQNAWAAVDRISEAAELANRLAIFKLAKKEGEDLFEAGFRARDVLDFGLTGRSGIVKFLATTVPFMNARAQGSYRLARGAVQKGNRLNFLLWGGFLAAAAVALRIENEDDERYRAEPDTAKDLYIHFYLDRYIDKDILESVGITNPHFTIPKPFELGFIAMTIPERVASVAIKEDKDKAFGKAVKSMGWGVTEIFKMNPLEFLGPAPKGVFEDVFNYNWHYDKPIIPGYLLEFKGEPYEAENVEDPYASESMKELAKILGVAPQRVQNYMNSIFPKVGNMFMTVVDGYYREAHGLPVVPKEFKETLAGQFFTGRFNPPEYAENTQYNKDLREMSAEIHALYNVITTQAKNNKINPALRTMELLNLHKDELVGMYLVDATLKEIRDTYDLQSGINNSDQYELWEKLAWRRKNARHRGAIAEAALNNVYSQRKKQASTK
tara:strand:+ start:1 stop:1350 length:1350 start_codon:yes stop_codon:yes gene_type:complete